MGWRLDLDLGRGCQLLMVTTHSSLCRSLFRLLGYFLLKSGWLDNGVGLFVVMARYSIGRDDNKQTLRIQASKVYPPWLKYILLGLVHNPTRHSYTKILDRKLL